jgi:hypothetical protein
LTGNTLRERPETPIGIDVVNNDRAVAPQIRPGSIELEADIPLAVQAVVNEKVN